LAETSASKRMTVPATVGALTLLGTGGGMVTVTLCHCTPAFPRCPGSKMTRSGKSRDVSKQKPRRRW
jgi:hypothetical protein